MIERKPGSTAANSVSSFNRIPFIPTTLSSANRLHFASCYFHENVSACRRISISLPAREFNSPTHQEADTQNMLTQQAATCLKALLDKSTPLATRQGWVPEPVSRRNSNRCGLCWESGAVRASGVDPDRAPD